MPPTPTPATDADADGYPASEDCDDGNFDVNPGVTEVCDTIDNDCDGSIDNGLTFLEYYPDADGDGYGAGDAVSSCVRPDGYATASGDCREDDETINPGATEVCNGMDDDCNDEVDEGVTTTYYPDHDGDGYGDPDVSIDACEEPPGYVIVSGDFDDFDPQRYPGADELCNGLDDDGDGEIDEGSSGEGEAGLGPVSSCLLAYWTFDEASPGECPSGADACDASGLGNDGSWVNAGVAEGLLENAISLNGSNAYVQLASPDGWSGGDHSITTSAWFYAGAGFAMPNGRPVIAVGTTANRNHFYIRAFSDPGWQSFPTCGSTSVITLGADDGSADMWHCSTVSVSLNTWYHVAATYDAPTRTVSLYVNGLLERSTTLSAPLNLGTVIYAGHDEHPTEYFDGLIDEARVYSRTLTAEEVAALYAWVP